MQRIVVDLSGAQELKPVGMPGHCICGRRAWVRWGKEVRQVQDRAVVTATVERYRCKACGRTVRHYPRGLGSKSRTLRLRLFISLVWGMGLAVRKVGEVLLFFGLQVSKSTVWRDVMEGTKGVKELRRRLGGRARVVGVDGFALRPGMRGGVVLAVDLGEGLVLDLAFIEEVDSGSVARWVRRAFGGGVEVVVTDDLASHRALAEELEAGHQVCWFHLRRWVGRSLRELEGLLGPAWQEVLAKVREIVRQMPADGDERLMEIYEAIRVSRGRRGERTALVRLRDLLARLLDYWPGYCLFRRRADVPRTTALVENCIGLVRARARWARGLKTEQGWQAALHLGRCQMAC